MAKRQSRSDSVAAKLRRRQEALKIPEPPDGLKLTNQAERTLWAELCQMRLFSDWKPADLCMLYDLVQVELEVRKVAKELKKEGAYFKMPSGVVKEHPRVSHLDKLRRQRYTMYRGLALLVPAGNDERKRLANNTPTAEDREAAKNQEDRPSLLAVSS